MTDAEIVALINAAYTKVREAYYPFYRDNKIGKVGLIPQSLGGEVARLKDAQAVQAREMAVADFAKRLEDGYKLHRAAILGIMHPSERKRMQGPNASMVVIEDDMLAHAVERAFKETLGKFANQLLAAGVTIPGLSPDVKALLKKLAK